MCPKEIVSYGVKANLKMRITEQEHSGGEELKTKVSEDWYVAGQQVRIKQVLASWDRRRYWLKTAPDFYAHKQD